MQLLEENPSVDFAFSATTAMAANKDWDHVLNESELTSLKKDILVLYRNNLIGAPSTTIFRRSVNLLFDNNLKWLVDIEFYIRMLSRNKNFIYTSKMLTVTYLAEGRVTDECENNREVEVFEYFYLFDKLKPFLGKGKSEAYRNALLKLIAVCKKYSLKNSSEIRAAGYKGKIPLHVISFIKLNSLHSITGRAYLKMLNATKSK